MLTTDLLWNEDVFTELGPVWDQLAQGGITDTPFQTLAYQQAWWRHLGPADLMTVRVRNEAGDVVGIAPFFNVDGVLHFNGCVEESDYLDLICKAEDAAAGQRMRADVPQQSPPPHLHATTAPLRSFR